MPAASPHMQKYFTEMEAEFSHALAVAQEARSKGFDPADEVEIKPAKDIASRVEGLVGPPGVADRIREILKAESGRAEVAFMISREILEEKLPADLSGATDATERKEKLLEQAIRTGLAFFTEGVVSAPIEGITKVRIKKNPDGTDFIAVYFSGPIRGAGGTGQAFTVILGDYCRKIAGIGDYRATPSETDRYVEESNLYAAKTRAGQYVPTEEEVRHIVSNCQVCVTGEPTEDYDVNVNKGTPNVESDRVRGGMCLVLSEGICLKAAKILKISKKGGLQWQWLEKLIKVAKKSEQKTELKPVGKFIDEIVGGRPIFAYPMRPGGFRLRYGRTRFTGIASKAVSPATMIVLDEFLAIGTQMKIERPGKGCIVTPCGELDGPIVLLNDGEVRQVDTIAAAQEVAGKVAKVLFVGDLLVNYGDFLKANHPLVPAAWCDEWYSQELQSKGVKKNPQELKALSAEEAFSLSAKHGASLAPKYTYYWHDLAAAQLKALAEWLAKGKLSFEWFEFKGFSPSAADEGGKAKFALETAGVPHKMQLGGIAFEKDVAIALARTFGLIKDRALSLDKFNAAYADDKEPLAILEGASGVKIRRKAGIYVGGSMGRPEKAKERKMKPPVHSLFPIAEWGGKMRGLVKALVQLKEKSNGKIEIEAEINICPICGRRAFGRQCTACGEKAERRRICANPKCGKPNALADQKCRYCAGSTKLSQLQVVDYAALFEDASKRVGYRPVEVKGVQGLISATKTPEPLEKGILRAKHQLSVFRDGTCRFDGTEIPLTHFIPAESGVSIERLAALGYTTDKDGKPITSPAQVVELKPQDVILPLYGGEYFTRVAAFVDDMLVYKYGLAPYYNAKAQDDLIGKLVVAIAPHTSAGILARIIGFSDMHGLLAHPYLHCACRRNADGDEISFIMLLDALINFSTFFLPETRGGKMDAPLVLTTLLDPNEIDDEAHAMDCVSSYPLEFYEASLNMASPSEAAIETVAKRLNTEAQYENIRYTHEAALEGPVQTMYVRLTNMHEKVSHELELMTRIRAVDSQNAAEKIILSHFLPDLYGNLHKFSKQQFRCVDCGRKFRRVPLLGKCTKCGGKLLLTINKGGIKKYLAISKELAERFDLPLYLKQRLLLIEKEIANIFEGDTKKQFSLADYA
ncbi:MAG: DNA polymerase II large subunit [Candidatus Micrarchaeota archaeon]